MSLPKEIRDLIAELESKGCEGEILPSLFSEDCDVEFTDLGWREGSALFDEILSPYNYKQVEGDYGGEGEGEYCYSVISLCGKLFKAEWTYQSYDGCNYDYIADTIREVFPREKMIIVYEEK